MSKIGNGMEFIRIDELHNLVVYAPQNGIFRSQIIQYPENTVNAPIRYAIFFHDVPEQPSVDECYNWAYEFIKNSH